MTRACLLLALLLAAPAAAQDVVEVTFQLNDALIKDRVVPGARVRASAARGDAAPTLAEGETDAQGRVTLALAPGAVFVDYAAPRYVPLVDSETRVERAGQVITTSLVPDLEGEGPVGPRRLAVVLNWGSDAAHVKDADSHLLHEASGAHVAFHQREQAVDGRLLSLDVDDTDWGGPETITLLDPPAGTYRYWVHAYSSGAALGASDVVVRVIDGGRLLLEARPPAACDAVWSPFEALEVRADGEVLVDAWTEAEVAGGAAAHVASSVSARLWSFATPGPAPSSAPTATDEQPPLLGCFLCTLIVAGVVGFFVYAVRYKA